MRLRPESKRWLSVASIHRKSMNFGTRSWYHYTCNRMSPRRPSLLKALPGAGLAGPRKPLDQAVEELLAVVELLDTDLLVKPMHAIVAGIAEQPGDDRTFGLLSTASIISTTGGRGCH